MNSAKRIVLAERTVPALHVAPATAMTLAMREVELKSVVKDVDAARGAVERAGATLVFAGRLEDRRYDTPARTLAERDQVLRVRVYRDEAGTRGSVDWKGPTGYDAGYKIREEVSAPTADPDALADILTRLGYVVTREIEREIAQYDVGGATVRFERYPRMDALVEVEGEPGSIERAIVATGLVRGGFTNERLPAFIARFEARTGDRAALCAAELGGTYRYEDADA